MGLAFGVSVLIGVVFGVLPAYRSHACSPSKRSVASKPSVAGSEDKLPATGQLLERCAGRTAADKNGRLL